MNAADQELAWRLFASCVAKRLDAGRLTYGDRSFSKAPGALLGELQDEALDLAGWGFVLWCRLRNMREALETIEGRAANDLDDAG
jgi:hypothetical protein